MRAAVTEVPGDAVEEEEEEDPHPDVAPLLGEALHLVVMDLLVMMVNLIPPPFVSAPPKHAFFVQVLPTGGATVQQETTELLQNPMTAHLQDPTTELHPSPLARFLFQYFFPHSASYFSLLIIFCFCDPF